MGLFDRMKDAQSQAQDAMQQAGGAQQQAGAAGGAMPGDMTAMVEYQQRAQKLQAAGVEAPGTVNAINQTGQTDIGGGQMVEFAVTISPSGGEAYQTTISQSMLPAQLEGISEGAAITVKYDPDNPSKALIYGW
jgi:Protein of unknown function (DUF3592)